jgi:hypothetical protein
MIRSHLSESFSHPGPGARVEETATVGSQGQATCTARCHSRHRGQGVVRRPRIGRRRDDQEVGASGFKHRPWRSVVERDTLDADVMSVLRSSSGTPLDLGFRRGRHGPCRPGTTCSRPHDTTPPGGSDRIERSRPACGGGEGQSTCAGEGRTRRAAGQRHESTATANVDR